MKQPHAMKKLFSSTVARGFNQIHGIDYDLTYSPTLNSDSIKLIISIASKFKWTMYQLDIK